MLHPIRKLAFAGVVAALAAVAPRMAAAQYGGTTGTAAATPLAVSDFGIYLEKYNGSQWVQMNTTEQQYFFNRARCECKGDQKDWSGYFKVAIKPAVGTDLKIRTLLNASGVGSGFAALYAGSNAFDCLTTGAVAGANQTYCVNLLDPNNFTTGISNGMAAIATQKVWESDPIPVARMFNAATPSRVCSGGNGCDDTAACDIASANLFIYVWTQTNSGRTVDVPGLQLAVNVVGQASTSFVPVNVTAEGGNRALTVRWEWPGGISPSGVGSFMGVQLFCVRGAGNQVFEKDIFSASYQTPKNTCPEFAPASSIGIGGLDPAFLCSGLLPSTASSYRIKGLQNDIPYGVAVAAVDKYLNASAVTTLAYGTPIATVDFYSEYKNADGAAEGGYCAVAGGKRAPGLLGAGLLVALGLLCWRRRRARGRGMGPLAVLLVAGSLLAAGQANAQPVFEDDMDTSRGADEPWRGSPRSYAIEARFGLYTPAIDSEFSGDQIRPHAFMFGTKRRPMWQLEFDWQFFKGFGSLALGGVVGYFKENASACKQATLTATNCERTGDNTSLRLIPLAALLVYRFDVLAEEWKIPLVPYGKIGLNYTFWNVTDGNGETPSAEGGKGRGGTAGWQATVGLALRLDFLDPGAARGFDADAGVNHTYAFFELSSIQSSGLGQKNALRVGDNTWFAGLTFEF